MELKDIERLRGDFKVAEERLLDALKEEDFLLVAVEVGRIAGICEICLTRMETDATPTL